MSQNIPDCKCGLLAYDEEWAGQVVGPGVGVDPALKVPVPAQHSAAHQVTLTQGTYMHHNACVYIKQQKKQIFSLCRACGIPAIVYIFLNLQSVHGLQYLFWLPVVEPFSIFCCLVA